MALKPSRDDAGEVTVRGKWAVSIVDLSIEPPKPELELEVNTDAGKAVACPGAGAGA